jgi:hypothetical protein
MGIAALLVISLIAPTIGLAETRLSGAVTDMSGTPIANAMVLIHWDSAGSTVGLTTNVGIKQDLVIRTTSNGGFKIDLPPGFYDLFVTAMAFSPRCRKIRIQPQKGLGITLRMNVDPLYTAEMGDRIEAMPPKH